MIDEYGTQAPNKEGNPYDVCVMRSFNFYGDVTLGNGTMFKVFAAYVKQNRIFVGIERHQCYTFDSWVHYGYVMEKLGLLNGDAMNIADWINCQLGCFLPDREQGVYYDCHRKTRSIYAHNY